MWDPMDSRSRARAAMSWDPSMEAASMRPWRGRNRDRDRLGTGWTFPAQDGEAVFVSDSPSRESGQPRQPESESFPEADGRDLPIRGVVSGSGGVDSLPTMLGLGGPQSVTGHLHGARGKKGAAAHDRPMQGAARCEGLGFGLRCAAARRIGANKKAPATCRGHVFSPPWGRSRARIETRLGSPAGDGARPPS